jgi:hypothetical protein
MIPLYQETGATVATLITYFFATILTNFIFKDLRVLTPILFKSLIIPQALMRLIKSFQISSS